jgi:hypothetical protein
MSYRERNSLIKASKEEKLNKRMKRLTMLWFLLPLLFWQSPNRFLRGKTQIVITGLLSMQGKRPRQRRLIPRFQMAAMAKRQSTNYLFC